MNDGFLHAEPEVTGPRRAQLQTKPGEPRFPERISELADKIGQDNPALNREQCVVVAVAEMVEDEIKAIRREGNLVRGGLTERKWFAGLAMEGMLAHSCDQAPDQRYEKAEELAARAYKMADAMLKEGAKC